MTKLPTFEIPETYLQQVRDKRLLDWLEAAENPQLRKCLTDIYLRYEDLLPTIMGSSFNHQAWPGGLRDHLADMCRIGWCLYQIYTQLFGPLPFTFDDVLVAIICHDAEKFVRYGPKDDPRCAPFHDLAAIGVDWEEIKYLVLAKWEMSTNYAFKLSDIQYNAVKYAHGEGEDHRKDMRVQLELGAFLSSLDETSARIFHSRGQGQG